ncbi:23S rRNA (pseudouridine(1915)-N(3))-methyltransferase RlmH [Thiohalomonas denitrificans]|uniref:Ribosomal RNA large subunit methyltransferase H n=1 Tax=Thiohalomonas denitrificans TaxID=415747 RepID=A0A1G5PMK7_9GAMM|nr:23S rRNA (pseudouridine(1915)-N(3))-methyltransferase RlmH [Thiohalomonas denitrificans]SCZ50784.1 23S rRNA (pseudouridine-1915-N(3)-) methyltransferase [Thiohalomonas denitrificans]
MRIHLIAAGTRMPGWVEEGFREYARRLPGECALQLTEIPLGKRTKNADIDRLRRHEGERMAAAIPKGALTVALEVTGRPWSTEQLSERLAQWLAEGRDMALLIGGPEGLDPEVSRRAEQQWSLSPLTLPHPLVRVVVAEQLYRAWTLLKGHPYHR